MSKINISHIYTPGFSGARSVLERKFVHLTYAKKNQNFLSFIYHERALFIKLLPLHYPLNVLLPFKLRSTPRYDLISVLTYQEGGRAISNTLKMAATTCPKW